MQNVCFGGCSQDDNYNWFVWGITLTSLVFFVWFFCLSCKNLREPQHTPGAYPRHPQSPKWKEFLHKLLLGGLGYVPGVCWKFLRKNWLWNHAILLYKQCLLKHAVSSLNIATFLELMTFTGNRDRWPPLATCSQVFVHCMEINCVISTSQILAHKPKQQLVEQHEKIEVIWFILFTNKNSAGDVVNIPPTMFFPDPTGSGLCTSKDHKWCFSLSNVEKRLVKG